MKSSEMTEEVTIMTYSEYSRFESKSVYRLSLVVFFVHFSHTDSTII
jgi:hypothetical protein